MSRSGRKGRSQQSSANGANKTQEQNQAQEPCCICEKLIDDDTEDSIFCDGICKGWMHRTCTYLSRAAFENAKASSSEYLCHYCSSQCLREEISTLKDQIAQFQGSLSKAPSTTTHAVLSASHKTVSDSQGYSSAVRAPAKNHRTQAPIKDDSRKFRLVVYGVEECPKGSSRLTRSTNDVKQVCEILKR